MGEYYRAYRKDTDQLVKSLEFPENFNLTWIAKLHLYEKAEIIQLNQGTAEFLGCPIDNLFWLGDYGTLIRVVNNEVCFSKAETEWVQSIWD